MPGPSTPPSIDWSTYNFNASPADQNAMTGVGQPDGGSPGPGSTPSSDGSGDVPVNPTQQAAISQAAQVAYQYAEMNLYKIPMLQVERDKLALQAAEQAAVLASQDKRLQMVDIPMVGVQRDQLISSIAKDNATLGLQRQVQFGQLGIQASQAFNQSDIARQGLASQDMTNAANIAHDSQKIGLQAGQQADQNELDRLKTMYTGGQVADASQLGRAGVALQAAGQVANQGLQAAQIEAQLNASPRNAFQAQAFLHGVDSRGLSNSIGAISGAAMPAMAQAQGQAQHGSLGSMYGDAVAAGQGQIGGVNGQGNTRYTAPNPLDVQGQIANQFANTTAGPGYQAGTAGMRQMQGSQYGQGAQGALWQMNGSLSNPYAGTDGLYAQANDQSNKWKSDPLGPYSSYMQNQSKINNDYTIPGNLTQDQVRQDTTGKYTPPNFTFPGPATGSGPNPTDTSAMGTDLMKSAVGGGNGGNLNFNN